MKKIFFTLCFSFILSFAYENLELIKGQALFLEFPKKDFLTIKANNSTLPVLKHPKDNNKLLALFALAYKNPPLITNLTLDYVGKQQSFSIKTLQGDYKSESLQVEPKKIYPPKNEQERIAREFKEANAIYSTYTPKALFNGAFEKPLNSFITSAFGSARIYNHKLTNYHSGTDFRALKPTPIKAANSGIVRIAKDRYYAGKSVVIDHGYGIYSQYYHLSKINVKIGQSVKKGEIIGLSGATGRVSGPHLHFGILVGSKQVDPLDFISKFNALFQ